LQEFRPRVTLFQENFVNMREVLHENQIETVDGVLFDLGLSSFQIDHPGKGFSFQRDEPLDMRMDKRQKLSAASLLRDSDEQALSKILSEYGEEFQAKRIARMIVSERRKHPIETTGSLASVVRKVVRGRFVNKSLARVFQALRIAVNDELNNLRKALFNALEVLKPGGRLVVISYHSLEDRIVKEFFRAEAGTAARDTYGQHVVRVRILTKKPVTPTEQEIALNSRARSAKMRVAERL
jgi:16S rRNA (cytosine1402-N4)-methyltransferase